MGNSRPLAAWTVMIRTASSSSSRPAPSWSWIASLARRSSQSTKARRLSGLSASKRRACSTTKRARRKASRDAARVEPGLDDAALGDVGLDEGGDALARALLVERAQVQQALGDAPLLRVEPPARVVEAAAGELVLGQLDVGAGVGGAAQGADDGDLVGRVVDGAEAVDQVAHFLGRVDQAAALDAVGHAGLVQGALERAEDRARRHEDGDVAVAARRPLVVATLDALLPPASPARGPRDSRRRPAALPGACRRAAFGRAPADQPDAGPGQSDVPVGVDRAVRRLEPGLCRRRRSAARRPR